MTFISLFEKYSVYIYVCSGLAVLNLFLIMISAFLGPVPLPIGDILKALIGTGAADITTIVWEIRIPRAIAALIAGAGLGASGAALQGLLRNPLAEPGILGVSSAAALGSVIALYFGLTSISLWVMPLAAIAMAIATTFLLYALGAGLVSTTRLILVGVGISAVSSALITLVMNLAPNPFALADLINWLFGSVTNRSFRDSFMVLPFAGVGLSLVMMAQKNLTALCLGEDTAHSLGIDLQRTRHIIIIGSALMTGASVALAGAIGFIGIVAPHLCRPWVGHDPGRAILPSALLASAMLITTDLIIRLLPFNQELRLGVVVSLIGAPAFIWIAARTTRIAP